jgi:tryptophan 7-halogenase
MSPIRRIVVAGSDPVAWIAATGLLRAFKHLELEVSVLPIGAAQRIGWCTLPSQRGIHGLLGIAEPQLVQNTGATFKLATEHSGWQGKGSRFLHAHGEIGLKFGAIPFYKFILAEVLAGKPERPDAFSIAGTAARLGRFARPMGDSGSLTSSFTYGFHFEDAAYTAYLRAHALRQGVRELPAMLAGITLAEDGGINALSLADGSSVTADYFIDCSGPEARLLGSVATDGREDWSRALPCDRMWSALGPAMHEPPALTQTLATTAGWLWRAPLAQASMVGHVFSSRFQSEAEARAALAAFEPAMRGEPRLLRFSPGRRRSFWRRNCLALGSAAVELEPLAGADLHFALLGLGTFIELFPRDRDSTIESAEYNRVMAEQADSLRDFTLAHYRAGTSPAGDFRDAIRAEPLPARLAHKLEQYASSGRIELLDHEAFEELDWAWLLMGAGSRPDALELQIRLQLAKLATKEVAALRTQVQQVAASMPPHMEYVRRLATLAARTPG